MKLLWDLFKRKRSAKEKPTQEFFDELLTKYNVSFTGDEAYEDGNSFTDKDAATQRLDETVKNAYTNLQVDFDKFIQGKRDTILVDIADKEKEIIDAEIQLDELNPKSRLFDLEREKEKNEKRAQEIEQVCFAEKQLTTYVAEVFDRFKVNVSEIAQAGDNDEKVKAIGEKQKEIIAFTDREASTSKHLLDSFRNKVHSSYYPPKAGVICFFYFLCIILMICEMGVSMNIVTSFANIVTPDRTSRQIVILIYSMGISLALAVIYKMLIDWLLFRESRKSWIFAAIHIFLFLIMTLFFSSDSDSTGFTLLRKEAYVLGFFSTCFALANGFLYREASYLHHLYFRMYPQKSMSKIRRQKQRWIKKDTGKLNKKKKELAELKRLLESLEHEQVNQMNSQIERLREINITSFWLGFDRSIETTILNNHEIDLTIIKKVKKSLYNEE